MEYLHLVSFDSYECKMDVLKTDKAKIHNLFLIIQLFFSVSPHGRMSVNEHVVAVNYWTQKVINASFCSPAF